MDVEAAVGVPCWNKACKTRGGNPRYLCRVAVEGKVTIFQKCHYCGAYNIRRVVDGVVVE